MFNDDLDSEKLWNKSFCFKSETNKKTQQFWALITPII